VIAQFCGVSLYRAFAQVYPNASHRNRPSPGTKREKGAKK